MFGRRETPEDRTGEVEPVEDGKLNGEHGGESNAGLFGDAARPRQEATARTFWPSVPKGQHQQPRFNDNPASPNQPTGPSPRVTPRRSRPANSDQPDGVEADAAHRLVVGKKIYLSGEIKSCEALIVEGRVEADLTDCKALLIGGSGSFKGSAEVEDADIRGHFEGDMTVTGTLCLRATGRITGQLRYADMKIEPGGKVIGTLEDLPPPERPERPEKPERQEQAAQPAEDASPAPKKTAAKSAHRLNPPIFTSTPDGLVRRK